MLPPWIPDFTILFESNEIEILGPQEMVKGFHCNMNCGTITDIPRGRTLYLIFQSSNGPFDI